jgi:magnesium chelatase subunit D
MGGDPVSRGSDPTSTSRAGDPPGAPARLPFSAVVGQDDAKLALTLAAVDPRIGGVLLRGHKGSAKTTLARGLAGLVGRFTELPLGTTEDRLLGTLDVAAALTGGEMVFRPGLLAAAHGGVLYVDEVNLLADHLVDALLDVAVSGEHLVERDGISHRHPARFVLVGSMNPEEGELRPQLLDRFGLCVDVTAPADLADRMEAVRRRLAHDCAGDEPAFTAADEALAAALAAAVPATVGEDVLDAASRLALAVGAEGLRADLTLCRAAAALAGLEGRAGATVDDVRRVAPLVLAHRVRRSPYDPPVSRTPTATTATPTPTPTPPNAKPLNATPRPGSSPPRSRAGGPACRTHHPSPAIAVATSATRLPATARRSPPCPPCGPSPPAGSPTPMPPSVPAICAPTCARRGGPA